MPLIVFMMFLAGAAVVTEVQPGPEKPIEKVKSAIVQIAKEAKPVFEVNE